MRVSPLLLLLLATTPVDASDSAPVPASEQSQSADRTKAADALDREDAQRIRALEQQGGEAVAAELERLQAEPQALSEADTRLLLKLLRWQGYTAEAGAALEEAVARFPESLPIARFEVAYRRDLQQREKAIAAIHRQIRLEPEALGRLKRAEVFLWNALGENDKAAEVAKEVAAAEPENAAAHRFLVHAMRRARRFDESRLASREAIRLSKDPYDNLRQLAEMEVAQGHVDAALEVIREARAKTDSQRYRDETTRWMLPLYDRKGQLSEWLAAMEKEQESDWRQALYLATAYAQLGRSHEALAWLDKVRKEHGDDPDFLDQEGRLASSLGLSAEARRAAERLVEVEPTAERRLQLAERLYWQEVVGAPEQLQALLTDQAEAIKENPYPWTALYFRLPPRLRSETLNDLFRTALESRQADLKGKLRLAEYHLFLRQDDAAQALLREVAFATPESGGALDGATPMTALIRSAPEALTTYHRLRQTTQNDTRRLPSIGDEKLSEALMRTRALVCLAALAVERGEEAQWITKLQEQLSTLPWRERVLALAVAGAYEPLVEELAAGLASPHRTPADLETVVRVLNAAERVRLAPEAQAALAQALVKDVKDRGGSGAWITIVHGLLVRLQEREAAEAVATQWLTSEEAVSPRSLDEAIRMAASRDDTGRMEELLARGAERKGPPLHRNLYDAALESYGRTKQPQKMAEMAVAFYQTLNPDLTYPDPYAPLHVARAYQYLRYPADLTGFRESKQLDPVIRKLERDPKAAALFAQKMKALTYRDEAAAYRHQLALVRVYWQLGKRTEATALIRSLGPKGGDEMWLLAAHLEAEQGKPAEALRTLEQARYPVLRAYDHVLQTIYDKMPGSVSSEEKRSVLALRARHILSMDQLTSLIYKMPEAGEPRDSLMQRIVENTRSATPDMTSADNQLQLLKITKNQQETAVAMAHRILEQPPALPVANLYDGSPQSNALQLLRQEGKLGPLIASLEKQAAADPLLLTVGLRLADAYTVNEQFSKLPALYRRLLKLEPGNATLATRLASTLGRLKSEEGVEVYLQLLRESPELLSHTFRALSLFEQPKQPKQLELLADYAQSLTPEQFADPQNVPLAFFRVLGGRLQANTPDKAQAVWKKGLELGQPGSREVAMIQEELIDQSIAGGQDEVLRKQLLEYFAAPGRKAKLLAFSRGASSIPWLRPPPISRDGAFRLPAFALLKKAIQLRLEERLLEVAGETPASEPYLSQLVRLAALDRSVIPEMTAPAAVSGASPIYRTAVLQTAAHETAEWPQIGDTPLRLLAAAENLGAKDGERSRQSFVRQQLKIARRLNDRAAIDLALQRWYELHRDNPSALRDSTVHEICEVGIRMVELQRADQAVRLLAMARERARNDSNDQAIARLEALITAASGKMENVQAIVTLLAPPSDDKAESTLFWSLSPGTAQTPAENVLAPLLPGAPPALLDGKFDLELLHLTPPNGIRRIALLKSVKASGIWKGKLPAAHGALGARLISGSTRFEGQWTAYAMGQNLLTAPDTEGWTTREGGPLVESSERLFPGIRALTPAHREKQYRGISPRITLKPGQRYFVSAWFYRPTGRGSLALDVLGYNDKGEEAGSSWVQVNLRDDSGWQYVAQELSAETQSSGRSGSFIRIPDNAKAFSIALRLSDEVTVTHLQLVELPDSGETE